MKYVGLSGALLAAMLLAACEKPKDETTEKDVAPAATEETAPAEAPAEPEAAAEEEPAAATEEPAAAEEEPAAVEEMTTEEVMSVPPTISEDAPKLPSKGEPPSPNQPQPVVPDESAAAEEPDAVMEEEVMEGETSVSPMASEDAPTASHKGEPPSPSQPQPVYPEGAPEGMSDSADAADAPAVVVEEAETMMTTPEGNTVVVDEDAVTVVVPPTVSEDAPKAPHKGEPPSPNQPQPVYPDGL